MLKNCLINRIALMLAFALGLAACNGDEDPIPLEPSLESVSHAEALPGTEVIIKGSNLAWANEVRFGETEAVIAYNSNSNIITNVPANAEAGSLQITVVTEGGTASIPFIVLEVPVEPNLSFTADNAYLLSGFGGTVELTAAVEDAVSKVVFFEGETELGEVTEAPYTWSYEVGSDVVPYTNFIITARVYGEDGGELESADLTIRVGERVPVSGGTLTGNGDEFFAEDGPTEPPFPSDGKYAAFLNFDGAGDLEVASGVNVPVTVPEDGRYLASLGLASGWADDESFMYLYFDDNMDGSQRSPEVAPTGWIDFHNYLLANPFELTAGEHIAKIRFGAPFVHPYYVDLFKF